VVLGFAFCIGLGLLWKWYALPTEASLSAHQVKDAANTAIPIALGMALGDLSLRFWPKRSKSKE
jgi:hypothetical protein